MEYFSNLTAIFPLSDSEGSPTNGINSELIKELSMSENAITSDELQIICNEHDLFLQNGGIGGSWQTILVSGLVIGVYFGANSTVGKQAALNGKRIENVMIKPLKLPYTNGVGLICKNQNLCNSDFHKSLFTDCIFENSCFENANLQGVDFSRSNLRNCSFKNADLSFADFENCDCTGTDFRGAKLHDSRFPGAILLNILR